MNTLSPQASIKTTEILAASWQQQLAQVITDPLVLCHYLALSPQSLSQTQQVRKDFALRVPLAYVQRIERGNINDPLLKQVLPINAENLSVAGFVTDPLAEAEFTPLPGLIHKYGNRVLIVASGGCAIHCRYCFRRHFPYQEHLPNAKQWQDILAYINARPVINEVIFSGGDPFVSSDRRLAKMSADLQQIPHLQRLRWHSRLPVVIPARVDSQLLAWLSQCQLQKVIVLHINHAQEIDHAVIKACQQLRQIGVTLLNQSVLLREINDDATTLAQLSECLFEAQILPYYLHQLDPVAGAAHFNVSDQKALMLVNQLRQQVAGFLVPRLVRECPGELSKTPLIGK